MSIYTIQASLNKQLSGAPNRENLVKEIGLFTAEDLYALNFASYLFQTPIQIYMKWYKSGGRGKDTDLTNISSSAITHRDSLPGFRLDNYKIGGGVDFETDPRYLNGKPWANADYGNIERDSIGQRAEVCVNTTGISLLSDRITGHPKFGTYRERALYVAPFLDPNIEPNELTMHLRHVDCWSVVKFGNGSLGRGSNMPIVGTLRGVYTENLPMINSSIGIGLVGELVDFIATGNSDTPVPLLTPEIRWDEVETQPDLMYMDYIQDEKSSNAVTFHPPKNSGISVSQFGFADEYFREFVGREVY